MLRLGSNYPFFIWDQFLLNTLALESTPGPEGGPDGQVLAISGPHVVLGGHGWVSIVRFLLGINSY